jgi:predicted nucleic acid-binding protein
VLYIDTSVLLVYTLTQDIESERYPATEAFFRRVADGSLQAATSFYALHELYLFALNNAPDFTTGALFGKAALHKVLSLPIRLFPFVSRLERALHARKLKALRDTSDLPHAIAALSYQCEAIVSYDTHFKTIARVIPYHTPEDFS